MQSLPQVSVAPTMMHPVLIETSDFECFSIVDEEPAAHGICESGLDKRCQFIVQRWMPFRAELNEILCIIKRRVSQGYAHGFPLRGRALLALTERNMQLTEQWYGQGRRNMCVVYAWFVEAMEICKVTAYRGRDIPVKFRGTGGCESMT